MNYDKSDLSDPLLKINVKNFGTPKPGSQRPLPPGIRKQRYDKIIPVMTAKKTFQEFNKQLKDKKIASHDKPKFKSVPATGVRGDQPASDLLKKVVTPGGLIKGGTINNPLGVKV